MMLNDTFVVEQSQVLATRLMAENPDRIADQMKQLWLLAFGCEPTDFHATVMHLFGLDHEKVNFKRNGQAVTMIDLQPANVLQALLI